MLDTKFQVLVRRCLNMTKEAKGSWIEWS